MRKAWSRSTRTWPSRVGKQLIDDVLKATQGVTN